MKSIFTKPAKRVSLIALVLSVALVYFSCTKTTTGTTATSPPKPRVTSFTASVNGSPTITFTPTKNIASGNTSLIGTSTYYTITLVFPSTTGTGNFFLNTTGFSASIYNGTSTYTSSGPSAAGSISIDSIVSGKYYGGFQFIGQNSSSATLSVNGGIFTYL